MNKPHELTSREWEEVAAVPEVHEGFGLEQMTEPGRWLSENAYGVRFDYVNGAPGYCGPLYLLKGDGAPETAPLALIRRETGLEAIEIDY